MEKLTHRVRGRITEDNWRALKSAASRKGKSRDRLINAALSCYFSFERDDMRDARIILRLDILTRHLHRVHRDTHVLTEMQALLSHYFFTFAPQYGDKDQDVRAAQGVSLLNEYIDELGERMKGGPKSIKNILDKTITVPEEEFFTSEELENFAALSPKNIGDNFG